ncbi:cdkn1a interacting zinc finger protein 1b isoform X2 [Triplophysa rosa]|uniref:cdkn1a interacting zinc finger protein 1b isoform X2 n=1 Tax=Triplophysa rosa TaxID=992332 RepID=UPI002545EBFF|nr:cdkn1a interacting zinc finger protein 1b isoform X2 [Triplophysa rosa]
MNQGEHPNQQHREPETGPSEPHGPGASADSSHQSPQQTNELHVLPHGRPSAPYPPPSLPSVRPHTSQNHVNPISVPRQSAFIHPMQGVPLSHSKREPKAFPEGGVRQSILGQPPIGSPVKDLYRIFSPGRCPHLCESYIKRDSPVQIIDKKENHLKTAGKSNQADSDTGKGTTGQIHSSFLEYGEPLLKKQRGQRAIELGAESANEDKLQQPPKANFAKILDCEEGENTSVLLEDDSVDQDRAAGVQSVGTSLKVTIQRSSESRAFSTTSEETDVEKEKGKFTCYVCNVACADQKAFQTHMVSLDHQQRMMEVQRASNTCLASLVPQSRESLLGTDRERKMGRQRWCPTCQCHFCGDLIEHRRTTKHKLAKISSRPFCTVCERHFRTPRKFVEHMKSPDHKQRVEELRDDGGPEVMEELITVDAVGCFEGEDDYEEDRTEEEIPVLEKDAVHKEISPEEATGCEVYDPDIQCGTSFVVPVAGFLCKLCHKFYHFESSAHETHCRSFMHFQNLQYNALKMQKKPHKDSESDVSRSSPTADSPELELIAIQSDLNTSRIRYPRKKRRSKRHHKSKTPYWKNSVSVDGKHLVCSSHFSSGSNQESYNQECKKSGVQVLSVKSIEKDKSSYDPDYFPNEHKTGNIMHSLCHVSQLNPKENVSQSVEFKETVSKDQAKQTPHVHKSPMRTVKNT